MPPVLELPKRPTLTETALRQKIDRAGELDRQIQLLAPAVDEFAVLKKEIEEHFLTAPAEKPQVAAGDLYQVQLSSRRNERTILQPKKVFAMLKTALGMETLIGILDLPLGLVDKTIPESKQAGLIHQERSGYRTFKLVPLAPQTPKAA